MNPGFKYNELKELMQNSGGPCVSIFMPTHKGGPDVQQDPIRLANLLKDAEEQLVKVGMRGPEARELLVQASDLTENSFFWRHQDEGLAIFASPGLFRVYHIPMQVNDLVVVTDHFHLKPLLRLLNIEGRFYLLSLSLKEVRLFECTRYDITEVKLEGIPKSIDEALKYDNPMEKERFHTRVRAAIGRQESLFRGHGTGVEDSKTDILRFFLKIDDGMRKAIGSDNVPLLVAGVDYLLPLFREANTYPHLLDEGLTGNPNGINPEELNAKAWELVEPYFLRGQEQAATKFRELAGTERASNDIKDVLSAAHFGRVESIFVPVGIEQWGIFDPDSNEVYMRGNGNGHAKPGDEDLLDLAAIETYMHGGAVYAVEPESIPGDGPLAAVYRY